VSVITKIGKFFVFIVGGIVTIVVGFFMLRGTMNLWNKNKSNNDDKKDPNDLREE
jgi:hypothetical protein